MQATAWHNHLFTRTTKPVRLNVSATVRIKSWHDVLHMPMKSNDKSLWLCIHTATKCLSFKMTRHTPSKENQSVLAHQIPPWPSAHFLHQDVGKLQMCRHPVQWWAAWLVWIWFPSRSKSFQPLVTSFSHEDLSQSCQVNC